MRILNELVRLLISQAPNLMSFCLDNIKTELAESLMTLIMHPTTSDLSLSSMTATPRHSTAKCTNLIPLGTYRFRRIHDTTHISISQLEHLEVKLYKQEDVSKIGILAHAAASLTSLSLIVCPIDCINLSNCVDLAGLECLTHIRVVRDIKNALHGQQPENIARVFQRRKHPRLVTAKLIYLLLSMTPITLDSSSGDLHQIAERFRTAMGYLPQSLADAQGLLVPVIALEAYSMDSSSRLMCASFELSGSLMINSKQELVIIYEA
ncbi:hypothetical protein CPB84DRAFT_1785810 [Gymnopilus junonius]|uniref:Uncharacterized protein n=1 Tax=Gymnopilus junonius TaxID=109634 RepID=A0A9P5NKK0_GYMJU|nr:hypothetical protein CPB84DRAFT_1785810 [Gymnopilus junonius]